MSYIAIKCTYENFDLRRDLLLFDKLALPFLENTLKIWSTGPEDVQRRAADLEWLAANGIVFVPQIGSSESIRTSEHYAEYNRIQSLLEADHVRLREFCASQQLRPTSAEEIAEAFLRYSEATGDTTIHRRIDQTSRRSYDFLARAIALDLDRASDVTALPLISASHSVDDQSPLPRTDVLQLCIGAVPLPAAGTPLEQLIEFRSDPAVRADYLALHRWAVDVAKRGAARGEVKEELEYLMAQYNRHLEIARIECTTSTLETVVTVTAEALEDIVKFKWGDAAKLLFSFRKRKAALLKAEATALGREVAYLVKAGNDLR